MPAAHGPQKWLVDQSSDDEQVGIVDEQRLGDTEGEFLAFPNDLVCASGVPVDDTVGVRTVANVEVDAPRNGIA